MVREIIMATKRGLLEVGHDEKEVIINHPDLLTDEQGNGYITFTPGQARHLARALLRHADELEHGQARQATE